MNELYGWYEDATQHPELPSYDPPHDAPCPYCGVRLTADDVRTHSFAAETSATRSYYYRTHRSCDQAASDGLRQSVFAAVIRRIEIDGEPVR